MYAEQLTSDRILPPSEMQGTAGLDTADDAQKARARVHVCIESLAAMCKIGNEI